MKQELVFVSEDSGSFQDEKTQDTIRWNKLKFADPLTYENHILAYDPKYIIETDLPPKGTKVQPFLEMRTPGKTTKVVVVGLKKLG
ncbi:hypothetical protein [Jeotgalibacillus terrae]|uniref:Uncharacterized protein n=1 Tax=Jeotgalibacillus terrae TaxID=587735 RepID=A0ABW5ZGK0_9BACL|nr:hypothetical protein [Jeotgalibacillus terrae]MBM7581145.1 hypothetical protein [Jeotgalibacillus terrae]